MASCFEDRQHVNNRSEIRVDHTMFTLSADCIPSLHSHNYTEESKIIVCITERANCRCHHACKLFVYAATQQPFARVHKTQHSIAYAQANWCSPTFWYSGPTTFTSLPSKISPNSVSAPWNNAKSGKVLNSGRSLEGLKQGGNQVWK